MTDKRKPPPPTPSETGKTADDKKSAEKPPVEITPVTEKIGEPAGNLEAREKAIKRRRGE